MYFFETGGNFISFHVSDLLQIDTFPKIDFDGKNLKAIPDCFLFETVSENIFFKNVVEV